jgi:hypothetical protein
MAHQVIDKDRAATDSCRIPYKAGQVVWVQVVRKQVATDHVEGAVAKGECHGIGYNRLVITMEVRAHAVQQSEVERDASSRQALTNESWNFSEPGGYLEHRETRSPRGFRDALD